MIFTRLIGISITVSVCMASSSFAMGKKPSPPIDFKTVTGTYQLSQKTGQCEGDADQTIRVSSDSSNFLRLDHIYTDGSVLESMQFADPSAPEKHTHEDGVGLMKDLYTKTEVDGSQIRNFSKSYVLEVIIPDFSYEENTAAFDVENHTMRICLLEKGIGLDYNEVGKWPSAGPECTAKNYPYSCVYQLKSN